MTESDQHFLLPRTPLGLELSKTSDDGQGVKLFFKGGALPSLKGLMQVCIISCIKDAGDERVEELKKTVSNYTGKTKKGMPQWDIFVLVPLDLVTNYEFLKDSPVHIVGYETYEYKLSEEHKRWRSRNVGDARNATLALGCALRVDKLLVSDDDRCYLSPNFNYRKKDGKFYWVNPEKMPFTSYRRFHHFRQHCEKMFSNKKLAALGFSSFNRRRSWRAAETTPEQMVFSKGNQHIAQLVMLNMRILNRQKITYLPIRMGEDTVFQYQLMKAGFDCVESSHLSHNSLPAGSCPSIARSPKNAQLENYNERDQFWLKKFFQTGCVDQKHQKRKEKVYWKIRWCPTGTAELMPNFKASNDRKSLQNKAQALEKKWASWAKNKKKIPDDPRLCCDDDPTAADFDYRKVCQRTLKDEGAGWQMMGELLTQMRELKLI